MLAPDVGSAAMGQSYAKRLGFHFALIDKRRYAPNKAEVSHLIGELENKNMEHKDDDKPMIVAMEEFINGDLEWRRSESQD